MKKQTLLAILVISLLTISSAFFLPKFNHDVSAKISPVRVSLEKERVLVKQNFPKEPITISDIKSSLVDSIEIGKPFFINDEDWLKGIEAKVTNVSGKPIRKIQIDLTMKSPSLNTPVASVPGLGYYESKAGKALENGGTAVLKLSDNFYKALKQLQLQQEITSLDEITLSIAWVEYTDDTAWRLGKEMRKDKVVPGRWNVVDAKLSSYIKKYGGNNVAINSLLNPNSRNPLSNKYSRSSFLRKPAELSAKSLTYNCASLQYTDQRICAEYINHEPCYVLDDVYIYWPGGELEIFNEIYFCSYDGDCCSQCFTFHQRASQPSPCVTW